jgi:hypothetical protein
MNGGKGSQELSESLLLTLQLAMIELRLPANQLFRNENYLKHISHALNPDDIAFLRMLEGGTNMQTPEVRR